MELKSLVDAYSGMSLMFNVLVVIWSRESIWHIATRQVPTNNSPASLNNH